MSVQTGCTLEEAKYHFRAVLSAILSLGVDERHLALQYINSLLEDGRILTGNIFKIYPAIFDCLDSELLSLLRILGEYQGKMKRKLVSKLTQGDNVFKNLVDLAGTGEKELTLVMECLALIACRTTYDSNLDRVLSKFTDSESNILLIKDLILLVDKRWEDEHLVNCLLRFVSDITRTGLQILSELWSTAIVCTVNDIIIKMFEKDPDLVSVYRIFRFPIFYFAVYTGQYVRMAEIPSVELWAYSHLYTNSLKSENIYSVVYNFLAFDSSKSLTVKSEKRQILVSMMQGKVSDVCAFEESSKIFLTYLEGLNIANRTRSEQIIDFLCEISDIHPKLLSPYFTSHFPDLWRKMCGNNRDWKTRAVKLKRLTLAVALQVELEGLSDSSLQDLESLLTVWFTEIKHPIAAGGLKLAWFILSRNSRGPLSILLRDKHMASSSSDTDEIGNRDNEKQPGLRYLISTIVSYLDKVPSYPAEYLISLTRCIVEITRSTTLEDELILLEDLVSPAMWLPKKASHEEKETLERIVVNVKEFLALIH